MGKYQRNHEFILAYEIQKEKTKTMLAKTALGIIIVVFITITVVDLVNISDYYYILLTFQ